MQTAFTLEPMKVYLWQKDPSKLRTIPELHSTLHPLLPIEAACY